MLVLMGHTKWPDQLFVPSDTSLTQEKTLSQSSKGALIQGSRPLTSISHYTTSDQDSWGNKRSSTSGKKKRSPSGLFDVLYDQSPTKSQRKRISSRLKSEKFKSPSYIEIEQAILAGHALSGKNGHSYAHTVTMIEENNLRRTGSVVSKEASLRHRNTIKRRNKIMKRRALEQSTLLSSLVFSEDSKARKAKKAKPKRCKLLSMFLVKRRTSYKYYPALKIDPKARFNSQEDVDDYFLRNNISSLMKDILPSKMSTFEFRKARNLNPLLESHPARFAVSRDAQFTRIDSKLPETNMSKVAFKDAAIDYCSNLDTSRSIDKSEITEFEDPDFVKRKVFLNEVHANYRRISFAGKRNIPLKLDTVLPLESEMMTASERETLNTQLLLEILLRRTLSAKIDFRLCQTRPKSVHARRNSSFSSAPSQSSSSSHSESSFGDNTEDHTGRSIYKPGKGDDNHRNRDWSAKGPAEFSSRSEFLPSPQISLKSKLLDAYHPSHLFLQNKSHDKPPSIDLHTAPESLHENGRRASNSLSSKTSVFPFSFHTLPSSNSTGTGSSEFHKIVRNYSLYDYEGYSRSVTSDCASVQNSLGNVNLALLRPLNRSNDTVSSISFSGNIPRKDLFIGIQGDVANNGSTSPSSASYGNNGNSSSTPDTSFSRDVHAVNTDRLIFSDVVEVSPRKFKFGSSRPQRSNRENAETPETVTLGMIVDDISTSYIPVVN